MDDNFLPPETRTLVPPADGWEPETYYKVRVAFNPNNPIHESIFYSGFLQDDEPRAGLTARELPVPGAYNQIWNPTYDQTFPIHEVFYLEVVGKLVVEPPVLCLRITEARAVIDPENRGVVGVEVDVLKEEEEQETYFYSLGPQWSQGWMGLLNGQFPSRSEPPDWERLDIPLDGNDSVPLPQVKAYVKRLLNAFLGS